MSEPLLPAALGDYRLLGLLGEGGAGRVYRAQESTTGREVALKVLRAGAVADAFHARFKREIALLAALEHPGIARLYAAGEAVTDSGPLPYLAMEYVRGSSLLQHAEQQRLSTPQRLQLMAAICEAAHHAHTRGIVHRDLKPGNILVDASGQPKVLDFGIAHVTGDGEATQVTRMGEVLGTLPYMSWEQLAGEPGALDPRADVFALGVISYQLLSGVLPFAGSQGTSLMQALKERQERTPLPLSRHLPAARGDVETMVMKAMAFDPAQRYRSAAEFAADLHRYLDQRPIEARPPTAAYVARLFVRRHKALAAGLGLAVAALAVGAVVALRYGLAEAAAREQAELRLQEREAINGFLERMLVSADPEQARGRSVTVREVVEGALRELDQTQIQQTQQTQQAALPSSVEASLRKTLAGVLSGLGDPRAALAQVQKALHGSAARDPLLAAQLQLAEAQLLIDLGELSTAGPVLDRVEQAFAALPADDATRRQALNVQRMRARWLTDTGKPEAAEANLRAALAEAEQRFGERDAMSLNLLYDLSLTLSQRGEFQPALALAETLEQRRIAAFGGDHPDTLAARAHTPIMLFQLGRFTESQARNEALLRDQLRVLGPSHSATLTTQLQLGNDLAAQQKPAEALQHFETAATGFRATLSATHPRYLAALNGQAYALEDLGRLAEAEQVYQPLIAGWAHPENRQHAEAYTPRNNLAMLQLRQGRARDADSSFERLLADAAPALGEGHIYLALYRANWAEVLEQLGRKADARRTLAPSLPLLREQLGPEHPKTQAAEARWLRLEGA